MTEPEKSSLPKCHRCNVEMRDLATGEGRPYVLLADKGGWWFCPECQCLYHPQLEQMRGKKA